MSFSSVLDTDSLVLNVHTEDIYDDLRGNMHYDTSNYEPEHPLYDTRNKKVVGKFKDELGGKLMTKFIGLKPKMYSFLTDTGISLPKLKVLTNLY